MYGKKVEIKSYVRKGKKDINKSGMEKKSVKKGRMR